MRVLVQDLLVAPIAVPVVMETVRVMERVHFVLELALNLARLKMNAQPKGKEQDPLHQEEGTGKMTEIKKKIEIMKGKEAKADPVRLRGAANPHQSRVQGLHVIAVDLDLEVILPEEGKLIGVMTKMAIVYMLLILM